MIVFDGSGSMSEMGFNDLDEPRIFEAREALRTALPQIAQSRKLGLVTYGPGGDDLCTGITLHFPPRADAAGAIIATTDALTPEGSTALTAAVALAAQALAHETRPATIVLVTDGKETCGGTPCQLAAELEATGIDTTVHVIGFKVRGDYFSWQSQGAAEYREADAPARCLADTTGGKYVRAETLDELIGALRVTLGCTILF
ncbi:VWA domain-containing protein [Sulfitobacter albidus]|uniref:VWA domain-containing protein n=2 Tax=Sulfitobacter albidus TaxID=2829501 RepID=A0A975PP63_9RHOB|nr:VWA domain-containing protein [Sulfitobacter albidus]